MECYHAKWCIIPPNDVLFAPKTCVITAQKGVLLSRTLYLLMFRLLPQKVYYSPPNDVLFTRKDVLSTPPNGVLSTPLKLVLLSRTLYLLVLKPLLKMHHYSPKGAKSPQKVHYYHAKRCVIRLNPCIYWCLGYPPNVVLFAPKTCIITTQNVVLLS